jgi:hypothetical protein
MEAAEDLVTVENITAACKAYDGARTLATDLKNDIRLIGDTAARAGGCRCHDDFGQAEFPPRRVGLEVTNELRRDVQMGTRWCSMRASVENAFPRMNCIESAHFSALSQSSSLTVIEPLPIPANGKRR